MPIDYGRPPNLPRNDYGYIAPGQLRGATFDPPSQHLWAYAIHVWSGKHTAGPDGDPDDVTLRLGIHDVDASLNPTTRRGYTEAATVSNTMNDQSAGQANGGTVAVVDVPVPEGVVLSAIPLTAGSFVHLDFLGTVGSLGHAMAQASVISASNERFYNRSGLAQPPPDPFGSYVSSTEGHPAIYASCDANVAPDVPASLAPAGSINDTAPTFTAAFNDGNEVRGDYLNQFRIQVRRVVDGVIFWDSTLTSTSAERTADAFTRAYGGSTMVRGTPYEWRTQMSDHFSAWGAWSDWTAFTPANLGFVTLDGAPTGKIEDNTPDFQGRWTHQAGTAMDTVQVRILNGAGTVVLQTGATYDIADVASSASPGTLFTVPWASAGLQTLAWGTGFRYQMRGWDGAQWSDWSGARSFATNAAPTVPTNLLPNNSILPITTYPLLRCTFTDADDTSATGLTGFVRVKDDEGAVLQTRTLAYDSGSGEWRYQTTAADLTAYGDYRFDAYSYDGTLYSGEATVEADATTSAEGLFSYEEGITITLSSPAENAVLTSSDLTVSWTLSSGTQATWAVFVYDGDGNLAITDLGTTGQTTTISDHPGLINGGAYTVKVRVVTDAFVIGESQLVPFTVAYTPPDPVANVAAEAVRIGTDLWASAIRITADQTAYGTDVWQERTITRWASGGPDAAPLVVARLTSPTQVEWTDYAPASGYQTFYAVQDAVLEGVETIYSDPVVVSATVELGGVVLVGINDPVSLRTSLRHTRERDYPRGIDETPYYPVSGADPTTVRTSRRTLAPQFDARLFDDDGASAAVRMAELDALDAEGGTLLYRDNHGRKVFVMMPEMTITDEVPDWWIARIGLRAETYAEGI